MTGAAKNGLVPLLTVLVREEVDIVAARQRARQIASFLAFSNQDQVRIATAVSEIARNAYQYGGGRVDFALILVPPSQGLSVTVTDNGPGIADLDAVLGGRHRSETGMGIGLIGSRRLMDSLEIETARGKGTTVQFSKILPPETPRLDPSTIKTLVSHLTLDRGPIVSEAQIQTRDLIETLESLRLREIELDKRHAELRRINAELEETNRGVVALYAELDEKAVALRSADDLKGRFLRHVSHEFRTPLNSILALTQLFLRHTDGDLTPEQERQVGYIRKAAQDLTEIVNDLLDLAKVEAGKTEVHVTRIDLAQFLGALRGVMRPLVPSELVALVVEDPPDFAFDSDESKVAQILRNLISNALKFTERGEVRVSSTISGNSLNFTVSDTGIGIAPEDQDRIFHEFSQVDNAIQGKVKGTGLGLPLSRKLASLLGGDLTVKSILKKGSEFTLRLPIPAGQEEHDGPSVYQPDCILLIDDEESARYIARQRFRGTRYRIIEASNGIEGAERARFERPALILLDLVMPDRSGFDVLDDLKLDASTRSIPVIIHTSRRLRAADFDRLANRHAAILPKGEFWPADTLEYIKNLLGESNLFAGERQNS